jgi:formylmethanofuran dehydrogenase subunit E
LVKNRAPTEEKISGESSLKCFACGKLVSDLREENRLGEEIICDSCRNEMFSSLEEAWVKHSAFLDSALN